MVFVLSHFELVIGLGNPGKRYSDTRHNLGFIIVDRFFENISSSKQSGTQVTKPWKEKDNAAIAEVLIDSDKTYLLKPMSYMNASGEPSQAFAHYHRIETPAIVVVHDELDLPLGSLRIKKGGGDAGHNGLRSLTAHLGGPDYVRMRVGIGKPADYSTSAAYQDNSWVLGRFAAEEQEMLEKVIEKTIEALFDLHKNGLKSAQNKFNS